MNPQCMTRQWARTAGKHRSFPSLRKVLRPPSVTSTLGQVRMGSKLQTLVAAGIFFRFSCLCLAGSMEESEKAFMEAWRRVDTAVQTMSTLYTQLDQRDDKERFLAAQSIRVGALSGCAIAV